MTLLSPQTSKSETSPTEEKEVGNLYPWVDEEEGVDPFNGRCVE